MARCLLTANHLRNRCPSRSFDSGIPYEKWTKVGPNLSYFKTSGCRGLSLNKTPQEAKLDAGARKCVFLGYSSESKGFRVCLTEKR